MKLWLVFGLTLVLTCASALGVVYTTHQSRQLLKELQQLEQQRNAFQVEWGQLLLEQSSLVSQGRLEAMAVTDLGMEVPSPEDIVVVKQ